MQDVPLPREGLATVKEAAAFLRVSKSQLYAMMHDRKIAYAQVGGKKLIPWLTLTDFLQDAIVPAIRIQ